MLSARRILFYLFILIYLSLCPLLILYSFGYILNPVNNRISRTGLIHLSTVPSGAHVYLGKSRYQFKTPASIAELLPGTYQLHLKLKGYRPWMHQVSVKAGESAAFGNILLIPEKLKSYRLSHDANSINLISLPDKDLFLVQKGSRLEDFYYFDWKKEKLNPLADEDSIYHDFSVISVLKPIGDAPLIVYGGSLWERKYLFVDMRDKNKRIENITKLFSDKPLSIVGGPDNEDHVFACYKGRVDRLDIDSMSHYPEYMEAVKGFGISGKWLYVLGKDNVISRMTLDKEQKTVLFEGEPFDTSLFNKSPFYKIQVLENDNFLFVGDMGDLIAAGPPHTMSIDNVVGIDFLGQTRRLMYWTKEGIWITDADRISPQSVYENGKSISQCFWAYHGTHIIFKDKDEIFLLELEPDGKHHVEFLANARHNSDVFYSQEKGYLYYLDQQGNLMSIGIVPGEGSAHGF